MYRSVVLVLSAIVAAGSWLFFQNYQLDGIDGIRVRPRDSKQATQSAGTGAPPVRRSGSTVRVASFNIQVFGTSKIGKPHVMEVLAEIVRRFDVVAIQEIRSNDQDILPQFVEMINAPGRHYDYVIGPRLGRTSVKEQYAYIFDRASIEVDRTETYTIEDPDDLLHRPPLVGWFRVRGPPLAQAFTFSLVNIHTDPDEVEEEMSVMDDIFRLVRQDGRNEDDIIVLGDFNTDDRGLRPLTEIPGVFGIVSGLPTNTRRTKQYDNVVFQLPATEEFTGKGGVFDFLREFNLTLDQALEISDHLPVWAEFSVYEGGKRGAVARADDSQTR